MKEAAHHLAKHDNSSSFRSKSTIKFKNRPACQSLHHHLLLDFTEKKARKCDTVLGPVAAGPDS